MNELGKLLRNLREKRGLNYEEVGNHLGCSHQLIRYHESGERKVQDDHLEKYSDLYQITLEYLKEVQASQSISPEEKAVRKMQNKDGAKRENPLDNGIWELSMYDNLFPRAETWKYLIMQRLQRAGYDFSCEPLIKNYHSQARIDYQLQLLEDAGISREAISSLVMWMSTECDAPDNIVAASNEVILQYADIALGGISAKHQNRREHENESGDYLDYRHDADISCRDLYYFVSRSKKEIVSEEWIPVDYRLTYEAEAWTQSKRQEMIGKVNKYISKNNSLAELSAHHCYGIYQRGSVYASVFGDLFYIQKEKWEPGIEVYLAKFNAAAADHYISWYEDLALRR